jgi:hypothetical protein
MAVNIGGEVHSDTVMKAWIGRTAEDVPQGWMDHAIRRMLHQANGQLLRLENIKEESFAKDQTDKELDLIERKAVVLARVSRNFCPLIELETERARQRVNLRVPSNEGARDALIRHVTKVLGPEYALEISEGDGE